MPCAQWEAAGLRPASGSAAEAWESHGAGTSTSSQKGQLSLPPLPAKRAMRSVACGAKRAQHDEPVAGRSTLLQPALRVQAALA